MKIRAVSDLHLELCNQQERQAIIEAVPLDCDVLVLAGDVDNSGRSLRSLRETLKAFADRFRHVVYVLGNHEFYGTSVTARLDDLRRWQWPDNLHWLDSSCTVIDGQRFVGCSLWFREPPRHINRLALNDYAQIAGFVPWVYECNRQHVRFLEAQVQPGDVVVTHHMPSQACVSTRYAGHPLNAFFVCDVEHVIRSKNPALWIHGHTHDSVDLVIGRTKIVCNPYGYHGYETNSSFSPAQAVEL